MDDIYEKTINSFAKDIDNLWRDKDAFSSLKSNGNVSIEDGNLCSFQRFMTSTKRGSGDDCSLSSRHTDSDKSSWGPGRNSMPLTDRLAKSASIWTLPDLSRMEADKILHQFPPGTFVVRMTTDKKSMVLSYRMEVKSQHVIIKVDLKKGFFMDGSQHVFRNVNQMIAHYMKHPIQNRDLCLKLPRALLEATSAEHFQFFESLKINFWTTLLAKKSISDIWSNKTRDSKSKGSNSDIQDDYPALPPRGYLSSEINILQGLVDVSDDSNHYQEIRKKVSTKSQPLPMIPSSPSPSPPSSPSTIADTAQEDTKVQKDDSLKVSQRSSIDNVNSLLEPKIEVNNVKIKSGTMTNHLSSVTSGLNHYELQQSLKKLCGQDNGSQSTISEIIEIHYPQLIYNGVQPFDSISSYTSLTEKILRRNSLPSPPQTMPFPTDNFEQYATPWDMKNAWLTDLILPMDNDRQSGLIESSSVENLIYNDIEFLTTDSSDSKPNPLSSIYEQKIDTEKEIIVNSISEDEVKEYLLEDDNRLQSEYLGAIESVMYSTITNKQIYLTTKSLYGQGIRDFLTGLCSIKGISQISKSISLFIRCTTERDDLNPYTSMRLIRQYMSGLKNLITKNKENFKLDLIIKKEISKTPKNVFINLDLIIESVLTKSVLKPLSLHLYRLLVLEHYKNNNLKLIAEGVDIAKSISPERLGLKDKSKFLIDSKIDIIRQKFQEISKHYSPEKKIKSMIAIVDIVFNMVKLIYPETDTDNTEIDINSKNILPLFVYIFSQCKLDAVATQCEVEYVEGLIWSSKLVNGEPGFFLLNIMSALEAIKVLARPKLNASDLIDVGDQISTNHFSLSNAAVGSVNVIIVDEKINRLITKAVPVRSTMTVGSLCNTISHRLGIFNPNDYSLYMYTGQEETLLRDHENPLLIKMAHQQKTGENFNFLFKRKNANFIIPGDVAVSTKK